MQTAHVSLTTRCVSHKIHPLRIGKDLHEVNLLDGSHIERAEAEAFVQSVFFKYFQAQITQFYPLLLTIRSPIKNQPGQYAAVAGIRPASQQHLFLEHYLAAPVEQVLCTPRQNIIEIGNLAPSSAGQTRWLITALNAFMRGAGFTHVVFTAGPRLRNAFQRMGLPLTELARASDAALPVEEQKNWGSYYQTDPRVYMGELIHGQAALHAFAQSDPNLATLCHNAAYLGKVFATGMNLGIQKSAIE